MVRFRSSAGRPLTSDDEGSLAVCGEATLAVFRERDRTTMITNASRATSTGKGGRSESNTRTLQPSDPEETFLSLWLQKAKVRCWRTGSSRTSLETLDDVIDGVLGIGDREKYQGGHTDTAERQGGADQLLPYAVQPPTQHNADRA